MSMTTDSQNTFSEKSMMIVAGSDMTKRAAKEVF